MWPTPVTLNDLSAFREYHPTYDRGILFGNSTKSDKGEVLCAFLEKVQIYPQKIVFVDDSKRNVQTVASALKHKGIDHPCIHYTRSQVHPGTPPPRGEFIRQVAPFIEKITEDQILDEEGTPPFRTPQRRGVRRNGSNEELKDFSQISGNVEHTIGESPFVVVPRKNATETLVNHLRLREIDC